jgi:hypothetical protein
MHIYGQKAKSQLFKIDLLIDLPEPKRNIL